MRTTNIAIVILAGAIASCGGVAEPARSVGARSEPDAALLVLDDAEAEIARVLGAPRGAFAHAPAGSAAPAPPPVAPPQQTPQQPGQAQIPGPSSPADVHARPTMAPSKAGGPREQEAVRVSTDMCSNACAALASMERAAQHLCDLAGASDGRCTNARDRVKNATSRVQAACPGCAR